MANMDVPESLSRIPCASVTDAGIQDHRISITAISAYISMYASRPTGESLQLQHLDYTCVLLDCLSLSALRRQKEKSGSEHRAKFRQYEMNVGYCSTARRISLQDATKRFLRYG